MSGERRLLFPQGRTYGELTLLAPDLTSVGYVAGGTKIAPDGGLMASLCGGGPSPTDYCLSCLRGQRWYARHNVASARDLVWDADIGNA